MTDDLLHDLLTAERGSRELSDRFLLAMGWERVPLDTSISGRGGTQGYRWFAPTAQQPVIRPSPTEDMQDTIEAVPEGHEWSVGRAAGCGRANVWVPNPLRSVNIPTSPTKAATPQLALCAAILKAKGAQDGS